MTATAVSAPRTTTSTRAGTLLRVDAAVCTVLGLPAALAAAAVADLLGPDVSTTVVRVVGIALAVYALDLLLLSRSRWTKQAVLVAGIGSIAWEVAAIVLVVLGAFSASGAAVALVSAAAVGTLGLFQLRAARSGS